MGEAGRADFPVTEDMVIAALLHDAVEDHARRGCGISSTTSARTWRAWSKGSPTALSKTQPEGTMGGAQAGLHRTSPYRAGRRPLIPAADKLYNARSVLEEYRKIGAEVWKRFKRGRDAQIWYFEALLEVFKSTHESNLVEELRRVVSELEKISAHETR